MNKQKNAPQAPEKKRAATAKRASTRRTTAVSANDNQIDNNPQTTPGATPKRKPVTNADEQKKTSNSDSSIEVDDVEDNVRLYP